MRILPLVATAAILLSASPAFAAMPGEPCAQKGATQLSEDGKHIIACLKTDDPDRPLVWKSSTGGSGGITGGCYVKTTQVWYTSQQFMHITQIFSNTWGRGCVEGISNPVIINRASQGINQWNPLAATPLNDDQYVHGGVEPGYSCGAVTGPTDVGVVLENSASTTEGVSDGDNPGNYVICVKDE